MAANLPNIGFIGFYLLLALASVSSYADDGENLPLDLPRTPVSSINGYYFPSLNSSSPYQFFDNFGFSGYIENIFVTGPNLNFGYGFQHFIQNNTVISNGTLVLNNPDYAWQSQDLLDVNANYSFLYFCQLNADVNYAMNRLINQSDIYNLYNYNKLNFNLSFIYDRRYSSLQQWTLGEVFIYPEEGYLLSLGDSYSIFSNAGGNLQDSLNSVFGKGELLIHPFKILVIAMDLSGQSLLQHNPYWAFSPETNVIGSYNMPGDYFVNGSLEMRFLFPGGMFWDTPSFWYFSSYNVKFSPGILIGYNAAYIGYFNYGSQPGSGNFINSVYISPMLAIRIEGSLLTVLRFDIAAANGPNLNYILSLNIGSIGSAPANIWRKGY